MGRARSGEGRRPARRWVHAVLALVLALGALTAAIGASASALAAGASAPRAAQAAPAESLYGVAHVCGASAPGVAACTALRLVSASLTSAELQAKAAAQATEAAVGAHPAVENDSPLPGYLTPQDLHAAYSLPDETAAAPTQTIAVIDAYDDPTAEADLGVYDEEFGLPACTSANGCFSKVNEEGKPSPLPPKSGEWAGEISIDVQMAHAICQSCHVLLVETKSAELSDLGAGVEEAVDLGATEVSNSYTAGEEPAIASYFSELNADDYDQPGLVVTAAAGDCGYLNRDCPKEPAAANFPADSPDVVGVGGTSLTEKKSVWSSTAWDEGGSGCSEIFTAPTWQSALAEFASTGCASERSVADVSAVGNPKTGVDVYDSTPEGTGEPTGWTVFGGTSVASPIIAAEFALAGGAHGVNFPAATLYAHLGESEDLYDVVSGANGSCGTATSCQAAAGYDGPTGVGSPVGLGAFATAGSPEDVSPPTISGIVEQGQTLTVTAGSWTNSPTTSSDQWQRCNASGMGCVPIEGAGGHTYELGASDVGATIRVQETAGNAAGTGPPADSAATAVVVSDSPKLARFTPSSGITGSVVMIEGSSLGGVTQVDFGKLTASFKVLSTKQVEAIVPDGAAKGKVSVTTPAGTLTSKGKFTPTLSVTSMKPASGGPGTKVTIKGVGFNASSTVSFDGVAATIKSVSSKSIKLTVPAGAGTGPIAVANTTAPVGTVFSAGNFTP
jgi:IPT/TIG domain